MSIMGQKTQTLDREPTTEKPSFVLNEYFGRIGYTGTPKADLATLQQLNIKHVSAIPFENLNPFLGIPVLLDMSSIVQKIVRQGRGGYCFEQNLLFAEALKTIGFKVKGLAARVMWNLPEGLITARGHMVLQVEVEGEPYIADVGFGGQVLSGPLKLIPDIEQPTPHEPFRLLKVADTYIMQTKIKEEWKPLYRFSLEEQFLADYEVTSWYLSNNPGSHFVTGLIAALTTPEARFALRGTDFAIHYLNGETEKGVISSVQGLKDLLQNVFKINLPQVENLDQRLSGLIK
jgi:N-hydroxyarylamine O-acetyltransferase